MPRSPERRDPLDAVAVPATCVDMIVAANVAPRWAVVFYVVVVNHAHRVFEIGDVPHLLSLLDYFQSSRPRPACQGFIEDSQESKARFITKSLVEAKAPSVTPSVAWFTTLLLASIRS